MFVKLVGWERRGVGYARLGEGIEWRLAENSAGIAGKIGPWTFLI